MKKIIFLSFAIVALLLANACQREGVIYTPDNACVSFPSDVALFEMVKEDGNKITVQLYRGNTKGSVSIPVTITDKTSGVFTPSKSSFDFADGESVATLDFTYPDINAFGGETYSVVLSVDEAQVSPSGFSEMTVKANRKLTRVKVGTGTYYSDWYEEEWPQDVYTTVEAPDYFILPSCWVKGTDFTFTIRNGKPEWPASFFTGYVHSSYGNLYIYSGDSYIEDGVPYLEVSGYRVSAGSFGNGIEYFVLPPEMKY